MKEYVFGHEFGEITVEEFFQLFFADGNRLWKQQLSVGMLDRVETEWVAEGGSGGAMKRLCFYGLLEPSLQSEPLRCVETQRCWWGAAREQVSVECYVTPKDVASTAFLLRSIWTTTRSASASLATGRGCVLRVDGIVECRRSLFWGLGGLAEDMLMQQATSAFERWLLAAQQLLLANRQQQFIQQQTTSQNISSSSTHSTSTVELRRKRSSSPPRDRVFIDVPTDDGDSHHLHEDAQVLCRLEPPASPFLMYTVGAGDSALLRKISVMTSTSSSPNFSPASSNSLPLHSSPLSKRRPSSPSGKCRLRTMLLMLLLFILCFFAVLLFFNPLQEIVHSFSMFDP
ncbi:MAG: hypothetical protein Q8P67_18505 [archaeon]|nr:hypothetical protein [archaeon]